MLVCWNEIFIWLILSESRYCSLYGLRSSTIKPQDDRRRQIQIRKGGSKYNQFCFPLAKTRATVRSNVGKT